MDAREKKFLKSWEKTQQRGKTSFLLKGTVWSVLAAILSQLITYFNYGLSLTQIYLTFNFLLRMAVYALAGTFVAAYMWRTNCKRYEALLNKKPKR